MKGFLFDEHISRRVRDGLARRTEKMVRHIGDPDAPAKGSSDRDVLMWCEVNDFVLVTKDHRTIPRHVSDHFAESRHLPGVLILRIEMRFDDVLAWLELYANATQPDELRDLVLYIPHGSYSV